MTFDIDKISLDAALEVEDLYCQHWEGGRTQRLAKIQLAISEAMQRLWDRRIACLAESTKL